MDVPYPFIPIEFRPARPEADQEALTTALAALDFSHRPSPFRPSRTNYPGSRFGPKTRYDLPQRHKAYGNADEVDSILYRGTSLQPLGSSLALSTSTRDDRLSSTTPRTNRDDRNLTITTPRNPENSAGVLGDTARSMFHPLADRNLPELPLVELRNDVHGILVIGGKGCGKTSVAVSFMAAITGMFPSRFNTEVEAKKQNMPTYGQIYELPEREVTLSNGTARQMRVVLTDTPPCGTRSQEEHPLCSSVSPNSAAHFNAIPSWMRITLRGGVYPHFAVLVVIDATALPLWEDGQRCREMARLFAVLRRSQYTVVLGVTKLLALREAALRNVAYGEKHGGEVGKDPRSSYEAFAGRYIDKVCSVIQAKAGENDWSFSQGPDNPAFPLENATIFDLPTWTSVGDFRKWQERKGTSELPNYRYIVQQLTRCLSALATRSHPE